MRCVILNRNYPPNAGITGYSAAELAGYLSAHGVEVHIVTVGGNYQGGVRSEQLNQTATIHPVRNIYDGKNKILRLVASLVEGRNMAAKAFSLGISPVIALTDPPLLNYWVARMGWRRRISWIYWAMDLYPEAFSAAGLASKSNVFYRHFKKGTLKSPPAHLIALGNQQAGYLQQDYTHLLPTTILPCGADHIQTNAVPPDWLPPGNKISFGYMGNLGQAHDPSFVEAVIAALDPEKHHFILSVYGIHASRVLEYASKFRHVTILSEVQRKDFAFVDIHLATLEPVWDHVCVPSKAVSAVCAGSCLLLCASDRGDNWQLLKDASWRIAPGPSMSDEVINFVKLLTAVAVADKRLNAQECGRSLLQTKSTALSEILKAVRGLQTPMISRTP